MDAHDGALLALATALLEHEEDALVVLRALRDPDGDVVDFVHEVVNATAEQNAGQPLLGRRQLEVYPVASGSLFGQYRRLLQTGASMHTEVEVGGTDPATAGRSYAIYARPVAGEWVVCQYRDTTQARAAERALRKQAMHDPLTGLPNRRLLLDHAELALARLPRHRSVVALVFCDLDRFKEVNDTYGHQAGDAVLRQVARRLQAAVRPQDTVARLGGDEFVVLSDELSADADALSLADRVHEAVTGAYSAAGAEVSIGVSIGVATTERALPVQQLLARADAALYAAKRDALELPISVA